MKNPFIQRSDPIQIRSCRVADPDPHHFVKLDPDPHKSEKLEALEGLFGALEGPNLEK
jgi:hypothetical protein